jgi:hypothetical protein
MLNLGLMEIRLVSASHLGIYISNLAIDIQHRFHGMQYKTSCYFPLYSLIIFWAVS